MKLNRLYAVVGFLCFWVISTCVYSQNNNHSYTDLLCVRTIKIEGNKRTKDQIIFRELSFKLGDLYQREVLNQELERTRQNIFNLDLFISVDIELHEVDADVIVTIKVKERLYLLPLPIFYLADRNFNEWWYDRGRDLRRTTYGIQLNHSNLTGNADELKLKTYFGFIPYYELSYNRPYIDQRQRMGVRGGVFFSTQKTLPYRTWNDKLDFYNTEARMRERSGAFVEYSLRNALYHSHKIRLGYTNISIADSVSILNPNYLADNGLELSYTSLSYQYLYSKVDNFQYPLSGQRFLGNVRKYGLGVLQGVNQLDLFSRYEHYFPLAKRWYFDFSVSAKVSFPQKQLYPLVTGLGFGRELVRGYQLNVVDGQHYFLARTNTKFKLLDQKIDLSRILKIEQFNTVPVSCFAKAFFDMGAVRNFFPEFSNTTLGNRFLFGGGAGIDLVTFYNTAFDLNYSLNQFGSGRLFFTAKRVL